MNKRPDIQKRMAEALQDEENERRVRDDAEVRAREAVERGKQYQLAGNLKAAKKALAQAEKWVAIYKRHGGK